MVQNGAMFADIRDPQRFTYSHAKGAFSFNQPKLLQFEEQVDFDSPDYRELLSWREQPKRGDFPR